MSRAVDPLDGQGELFPVAPTRALRGSTDAPEKRAPRARSSIVERPSWKKHTGRHEPCAIGVRNQWAADRGLPGGRPHVTAARYVREFKGERHPMCHDCAVHWREADGFSNLPG